MVLASMGPQAFGSAQSYAMKQFERALFQIATGDGEDADHHAQSNLPGAQRKANKAQEAASAPDPWSGPLGKMQLKAEMRELSKRMNGNALGTTDRKSVV